MLYLHSCGTFELMAVWYAPAVDIVKVGLYVIVTVFSAVGSFRHFIGLLLNGLDDEDDYEIEILKRSKQINMVSSSLTLIIWLLLRKVTYISNFFHRHLQLLLLSV